MSTITKGDWFRSGTEIVAMPSQVKITNRISGATYEEAVANAKLVSMAPKLLSALEDAVTGLEWHKESNISPFDKADEEKIHEWKQLIKQTTE